MKDSDYATPSDHYFGYITKRLLNESENEKERDVMESLELEKVLDPVKRIVPNINPKEEEQVNLDEVDIFELARSRGVRVN
jgi:hypothetical protein